MVHDEPTSADIGLKILARWRDQRVSTLGPGVMLRRWIEKLCQWAEQTQGMDYRDTTRWLSARYDDLADDSVFLALAWKYHNYAVDYIAKTPGAHEAVYRQWQHEHAEQIRKQDAESSAKDQPKLFDEPAVSRYPID